MSTPIHMINGLHAPNAAFTPDAYQSIKDGHFRAVKVFMLESCWHDLDTVHALQDMGVTDVVGRLIDSRRLDGRIRGADEYAEELAAVINLYYREAGIRVFQVDNEPNWTWITNQFGCWQYQFYMKRVIAKLRDRLISVGVQDVLARHPMIPDDVILIAPPLSFAPALWSHDPPGTPPERRVNPTDFILNDWLDAFQFTDGGHEHSLWSMFDYASANCYFQSDRQLADPSFGTIYRTIHNLTDGMPVAVTEWASSAHELRNPFDPEKPRYTEHEIEVQRIRQYPEWINAAENSGIVPLAFLYLAQGSTLEWAGYRLTKLEAQAIGFRYPKLITRASN